MDFKFQDQGSDNLKLGEDKLIQELSEFSCPQNADTVILSE